MNLFNIKSVALHVQHMDEPTTRQKKVFDDRTALLEANI